LLIYFHLSFENDLILNSFSIEPNLQNRVCSGSLVLNELKLLLLLFYYLKQIKTATVVLLKEDTGWQMLLLLF
jgi:hypothetical protein